MLLGGRGEGGRERRRGGRPMYSQGQIANVLLPPPAVRGPLLSQRLFLVLHFSITLGGCSPAKGRGEERSPCVSMLLMPLGTNNPRVMGSSVGLMYSSRRGPEGAMVRALGGGATENEGEKWMSVINRFLSEDVWFLNQGLSIL